MAAILPIDEIQVFQHQRTEIVSTAFDWRFANTLMMWTMPRNNEQE